MIHCVSPRIFLAACLAAWLSAASAEVQSVTIKTPAPPITAGFKMGGARNPDGDTLTMDSRSLLLNGKRWLPVMGEFHFTRYPQSEWREELLKMKAGGVDIVSTYVFWIHHEEVEGQFDWTGSRDLRRFIQTCQDAGLKVVVRSGPWDHGEVRNGGFPDWLLAKGWKLRSNDTNYLAAVKIFYGEIAQQLHGLYWKDGGPIIGVQFENEYNGPASHLMTLKKLGEEVGFDAPLYTRTGWNKPSGNLPFGELIPLYGVYAEGFWDRKLVSMPAGYWKGFHFSTVRADDATFAAPPGKGGITDVPDADQYPYLTCEIGGGMMNSYHRRILIHPEDIEATTLIKLGSGSTLLGYYMYHGGVNPDGKLSTLMESQATGYWNDLPVKNYDFQAPLGQYGQVREQYNRLRRLHLFLHEWGSSLAAMPATMPDDHPLERNDFDTLRWSARSDGTSGFVFVNNYERSHEMPPKTNVQFSIHLPSETLVFPKNPVTIPSDACLIWPFNLDLGGGVRLSWATAQPLTAIDDGKVRTLFFAETKGVTPQFAFAKDTSVKAVNGHTKQDSSLKILDLKPSNKIAARIETANGDAIQIVVLSESDSFALWKGQFEGRDRIFLTKAGLVLDGDKLRLTSSNPDELNAGMLPDPAAISCDGKRVKTKSDGIFHYFTAATSPAVGPEASFKSIRAAGEPREIPLGTIQQPVAAAPLDADFEHAAVWSVKIPADVNLDHDPILRFHYVGDVARITLNGKLLTDDFYNGKTFDIGLRRYAPEILQGDLRIEILPLRKNAPIFMDKTALLNFGAAASIASLDRVEIVQRFQTEFANR